MSPGGEKVATRVKNKILKEVYMASEAHIKRSPSDVTTKSFGPQPLKNYETISPSDFKKWSRSYKSLKVRGEALFDIYLAANCRFDILTSQKEITPNFLEMRNADCKMLCSIIKTGQLPTKAQLRQIRYKHTRELEKKRYEIEFERITKDQFQEALLASNEPKTKKEKKSLQSKSKKRYVESEEKHAEG